ncbi:Acetyltransferase (GNAT) family protein [Halogranum gelatinilyticum]|uniref:Acetyltransferase (GNAT) family protein n=1 Tax=Halogranum gelatinilyticum TaxID=660521 RepID=A0A1G9TMH1_9EURY|nr:N-acetyltransferase [Halogranum gelatinilyticum]SDM48873.1 Acetyltransferase (GNAT) family protein [Halogranum gelatinilyticum]
MDVRPYTTADAEDLWQLKRGFELGLGAGTGGEEKQAKYEAKLTDEYRSKWLAWVDDCVADDERCVTVAVDDGGEEGQLVGYVFVLPASMAFIWDAAVLNEVYVAPDYRGTGVADDLMESALALARDMELPLDRLVLDVDRENDRAQAFYDRYGFEHWGELVARDL